ncbi:hypothetical protein Enr10x_47020 [Gimesia panareensis]|uniref:Intracellular proteinase inhibitor n=1 Tax=Gimesia panareensis TaxID=2527978 RepID=A0A517QCJ5_9PLAN|nr:hypothetical protein [Gimesia panareensis]QDT29350.1 hypothetical protein Enr10x_47020 [Gimesia panareensis]
MIYQAVQWNAIKWLLLLLFSCSLVTSVPAEDKRVRLTIPPEQPPDPAWRKGYLKDMQPLKNRPVVVSRKKVKDEIHVVIKNTGATTLEYYATSPERIQLYQEVFRAGLWRKANWDWCGTGKKTYKLAPGQSVKLEVHFFKDERGERMLGAFREAGTKRWGLIVLATEGLTVNHQER